MASKIRPIIIFTVAVTIISLFSPTDSLATGWYGVPVATGPTLAPVDGTDNRWRLEYNVGCTKRYCGRTDEVASLISKGIDPFSIETYVVKNGKLYSKTAEVIPQADPDDTCGVVGNNDYYVVKSDIDLKPPYTYVVEITSSRTLKLVNPGIGQKTFSVQDWKCHAFSLQILESVAEPTQLSCETITRYGSGGEILLSLECCFNPLTREVICEDPLPEPAEVSDYPAGNVICTLCENGVVPDGNGSFDCAEGARQTIRVDSSKDQCFLGGERNPDAIWYYYRGRWYCYGTECP